MSLLCSVPVSDDATENRIYFDMLKIMRLDIAVFNHLFDQFNGGKGLHSEFPQYSEKGIMTFNIPIFVKSELFLGSDGSSSSQLSSDRVCDQYMRDPYDVLVYY